MRSGEKKANLKDDAVSKGISKILQCLDTASLKEEKPEDFEMTILLAVLRYKYDLMANNPRDTQEHRNILNQKKKFITREFDQYHISYLLDTINPLVLDETCNFTGNTVSLQ